MKLGKPAQLIFFAASALYFELAIIRFTAAEVLYLGYFSNFILITAFVGLGTGFLSDKKGFNLDGAIPFTLLFLFAIVLVSVFDVNILRNHFGLFFFGNVSGRAGLPGAVLLVVLFLATAAFFVALGNRVARAFALFKPLDAYTYDLIGSLLGIAIFTLQSTVAAGPVVWVMTGTLLICLGYLAVRESTTAASVARIAMAGTCVVLLLLSSDKGVPTVWSTYQKLTLSTVPGSGVKVVRANGIIHQFMNSASAVRDTYYGAPYRLALKAGLSLDRVLIIGAGTGTDVAVALDYGAHSVDAVEIDRRIVDWGKLYQPDAPYADPRVNIYITDGRKFLHDSRTKYDLIVFALPDSLTRISAMASIRLESYLFTTEAFASVRGHLAHNGIFVMYNQYRWRWLVNKLAATADKIFGRPPQIIAYGTTTVIAAGDRLQSTPYSRSGFERLPSDDWPFLYMQRPAVHWLYISMIAMFLIASLVAVHFLAPRGTLRRPDFPFLFMGTAFMLLETKSLAFFSLLFGTTWLVNSLAFAGILLSVLIANLTVQKFHISRRWWLYAGLFISIAVAFLLPARDFLGIDMVFVRYILAVVLVFSPIFFANLVFSREFRDTEESTRAFGWNLLGAVAGGGLEYLSLVIGYRDLLWIVALCYLAVAVFFYSSRATGDTDKL